MNIEQIKVYRINDKVVWTDGDGIEKLEKLLNREIKPEPKKVQPAPTPVIEQPKPQQPQNGTKLERAKALFDATKSRKEMIAIFVAELNMTPAGASTYHAQCKKLLN